MEIKRIGLVGVGAWGSRLFDAISRRTNAQVVAYLRSSTAKPTHLTAHLIGDDLYPTCTKRVECLIQRSREEGK